MRLIDRALGCSLAASLAYLSPTQLSAARREWRHTGPFTANTAGQAYANRLKYSFSEQVIDPRLRASASIFESTDEDAVIVAFRGSTSIQNFRTMFTLNLVPLVGSNDAKVHAGYQEASKRLYELLQPVLERRTRSETRVYFTGHSYGGGTATLCALYHQPDELLTFSAPLLGDEAFADAFDMTPAAKASAESKMARLGERTVHFQHAKDPLLQQNQLLWRALGYAHTGRVVGCLPHQARLLEEVAGSSTDGPAWNIFEHCHYLDTYMGPRLAELTVPKLAQLVRPRRVGQVLNALEAGTLEQLLDVATHVLREAGGRIGPAQGL